MDQDSEVSKSQNLQSRTELRKLVKSKRFSCSRWLMNVVSFLEGLRPDKLRLVARRVCRVQRVSGQPKTDVEYGIERGAECLRNKG
jgi:hypothetical protein